MARERDAILYRYVGGRKGLWLAEVPNVDITEQTWRGFSKEQREAVELHPDVFAPTAKAEQDATEATAAVEAPKADENKPAPVSERGGRRAGGGE